MFQIIFHLFKRVRPKLKLIRFKIVLKNNITRPMKKWLRYSILFCHPLSYILLQQFNQYYFNAFMDFFHFPYNSFFCVLVVALSSSSTTPHRSMKWGSHKILWNAWFWCVFLARLKWKGKISNNSHSSYTLTARHYGWENYIFSNIACRHFSSNCWFPALEFAILHP